MIIYDILQLTCCPIGAFNNDVEIWKQSGSRTDVYDPYSNELLKSRYRDGNKTIIRTPDNEEQEIECER